MNDLTVEFPNGGGVEANTLEVLICSVAASVILILGFNDLKKMSERLESVKINKDGVEITTKESEKN